MSELPVLDGPRYGPAGGGVPTQLIILLHGVGADGHDLIEMAPHLGQVFPNAALWHPTRLIATNRAFQAISGFRAASASRPRSSPRLRYQQISWMPS